MTKKKDSSHCVMGNNSYCCTRCGDEFKLPMPMSVNMITATTKAFIKDHINCKPSDKAAARFAYKTYYQWATSWDTGMSSKAIYRVCTGLPIDGTHGVPRDGDDFGRCYRFLHAFPELHETFKDKMGEKHADWKRLVDAWEELESLYEEELPSGKYPKLNARIRQLTT